MGNCCPSNIEIIDEKAKGKEYDQLRPKETITYTIDRMYNVPEIQTDFNGQYISSVKLWPQYLTMRSNFMRMKRTPPSSPDVSSLSYESGSDLVF